MAKRKNNIKDVTFTYVGTDAQFNDFLRSIIRDYLVMDNSPESSAAKVVAKVESEVA